MKKTIAKALALTCTALLSTAAFAQEESSSPVQFETQAEESVLSETPAPKAESKKAAAGSLTLNKSEFKISLHGSDYGENHDLWVEDMGGSSAKSVKWHSSDTRVVRVNQKGKLFPQGLGTATITASTKDGYEGTCQVEVTKYDRAPESAGFKITEQLHGESSVTFGLDIDTGKAGFTNNQNIDFKMEVLTPGATGALDPSDPLPVWGEIRVVTDGDPIRYMIDSDDNTDPYFNNDSFKIVVDYAKIHLGPAYINLWDRNDSNLGRVNYATASDVAYAFMGVDTSYRYGHMVKKPLHSWLSSFDADTTVYGIQAGYALDGWFKVQGDIASTMKWVAGSSNTAEDTAAKDATDWLYKISADFTGVPYLNIQAGFSNGILGKDSVYAQDMRFGLKADYTLDLFGGSYYLKPSAGATFVQLESRGTPYPLVTGGILFGWQDRDGAFDYWSTKYDKDDNGAYPGVAFSVEYADSHIAEKSVYFSTANGLDTLDHNVLILHGSFNTGDGLLLDGLQAVGAVDVVDVLSNRMVIGTTLGAKYWIPVAGNFSLEPRCLITRYWDTYNNVNDYLYAKACLCLNYSRLHLELNWESNDLLHGFNDGKSLNRLGKFETTFKVNFCNSVMI